MKSKFTSILMFFIIVAIIVTAGLIGLIIWEEVRNYITYEISEEVGESELFKTDESEYTDVIENIEVPKIRNRSNPLEDLQKTEEENIPEVNYENVTVNKYFYSQLNEYSKTIYKAFETNKENMKSGRYKINLGSSFSNILSKENGQDELGNYYQSAIEAYIYDNPDVFYLSPSKMYLNIETTTRKNIKTYNIYIDCGEQNNYLTDAFSTKSEVDEAIAQIESIRKSVISKRTGNVYKDIKMIHDYLINNVEYDMSISKDNIYNIYGALINHECVCEGYAEAFKYLLDGLGIESTMVIGKGTNSQGNSENHAWNYVKLNETWYAVDVTWDDPVIIGGGTISKSTKYKYFLKGSNTMNEDHFPSGKFTENGMTFTYPQLSSKDY